MSKTSGAGMSWADGASATGRPMVGTESCSRVQSSKASHVNLQAVEQGNGENLESQSESEFFIPFEAQRLADQTDLFRSPSPLIIKLFSSLLDQSVTIAQGANDISADSMATSDLLKLANSPGLGLRKPATNVFDAVNQLGIRRSVALIVAANVFRMQTRALKSLPEKFTQWYQQRSNLLASTSFAFANGLGGVSADAAYVLSLLQDIGILVMLQAYGHRYQRLLERVQDVGQLRFDAIERQELGITHADVSAALLRKWDLPAGFVSLVFRHHDEAEQASDAERNCLRVMQLGEALANLLDCCAPQRLQILQVLLEEQPVTLDQVRNSLALALTRTAETSALYAVASPDKDVLRAVLAKVTRQEERQLARGAAPPPHSRMDESGPLPYWLVIDDEPIIGKLVARILRSINLAVKACSDMNAAMQLAGGAQGILCDVHLGKERGTDIVRTLRECGITAPVLMMTSDAKRSTVMESIDAGVSDYILKPVTAETLIEKIRQHQPESSPVPDEYVGAAGR